IVGTGQSGPSLTERMSKEGWNVAVLERHRVGGTCINTGCVPTKTLVANARAAYMARRASDFGVMISGPIQVDMKRSKARKDQVSTATRNGVEERLAELKNVTLYRGHGRFTGPHRIDVNGQALEAEKIFLNVGARAVVPDIAGLSQVQYLTNSSMME